MEILFSGEDIKRVSNYVITYAYLFISECHLFL